MKTISIFFIALLLAIFITEGFSQEESIVFTAVPAWGSSDSLQGRVYNAFPAERKALVYIFVEGTWWPKPYYDSLFTTIAEDCTWICDVTTGGIDEYASRLIAFLVPADYVPPEAPGQWGSWPDTLPSEYYDFAYAFECRMPGNRVIQFSGLDWIVKQSDAPIGPNSNWFSDDTTNVWVDEYGELHLKITEIDTLWYCSEVVAQASFGYGTYVFYLRSRVDTLDLNAVLGLFTWDEWAPPQLPYYFREMDIEFSRWGNANTDSNAQFVVQPYYIEGNRYQFEINSDSCFTCFFRWSSDSINFAIARNYSYPPNDIIEQWCYTDTAYIPTPGQENPRINLWLNNNPPANGQDIEMIIHGFEFIPDSASGVNEPIWEGLVVEDLKLLPPYPNPFNNRTALSFNIPFASTVNLTIYNIQGKKIRTLVDTWKPRGFYRVYFDGSNLANGIYFAELKEGERSQRQKLLLLK